MVEQSALISKLCCHHENDLRLPLCSHVMDLMGKGPTKMYESNLIHISTNFYGEEIIFPEVMENHISCEISQENFLVVVVEEFSSTAKSLCHGNL